jgi:hypothetical protein
MESDQHIIGDLPSKFGMISELDSMSLTKRCFVPRPRNDKYTRSSSSFRHSSINLDLFVMTPSIHIAFFYSALPERTPSLMDSAEIPFTKMGLHTVDDLRSWSACKFNMTGYCAIMTTPSENEYVSLANDATLADIFDGQYGPNNDNARLIVAFYEDHSGDFDVLLSRLSNFHVTQSAMPYGKGRDHFASFGVPGSLVSRLNGLCIS